MRPKLGLIFLIIFVLIFSVSVVSASENTTDELQIDELETPSDFDIDEISTDTSQDKEISNGRNQNNVLGANNEEKTPLRAVDSISMEGSTYVQTYGYTFDAIRHAINDLSSGGKLFLGGKTYTQSDDGTAEVSIFKSISIYGGYTEDDGIKSTWDARGKSRIIGACGDYNINLYNLNLINGYQTNIGSSIWAGSVYNCNGLSLTGLHMNVRSLRLSNVKVDNCTHSPVNEGLLCIVFISAHTFNVENCIFSNLELISSKDAGAVVGIYGSGQITNCSFINGSCRITGIGSGVGAGAGLQAGLMVNNKQVLINNCRFENNTLYNINGNGHGGALCMVTSGITCANSIFINNKGDQGGATQIHTSGTLENCTFINNTATTKWGGAVSTGLSTDDIEVNIINCNFSGNQAPIGGAVQLKGNDIDIVKCTFENNSAVKGGACYIQGQRAKIENSNFVGNNATHNLRKEVTLNATVKGYVNEGGAIYIGKTASGTSDNALISNNTFESNNANNGAGVYVLGNNAKVSYNDFNGNNVTGKGGAAYIDGDKSEFRWNNFTKNNAIPQDDDISVGLGGAIYVLGRTTSSSYTQTYSNTFQNNAARNGSAIYTNGNNFHLENDKFYHNQAYSYLLITTAVPETSKYNESDVNVTVVHIGGDNILNAIHNAKAANQIKLQNVSYINSTGGLTQTSGSEVSPVNGVENSNNGTLLYQDNREAYQDIILRINHENDRALIFDDTLITDIYGKVNITLNKGDLKRGLYKVNATHPEDWNYKYITNSAEFRVYGYVDLSTTKTTKQTEYFINNEVIWTITVHNTDNATTATFVNLTDVLPSAFEYITSNAEQGAYSNVTNNWTIGTLNPGQTVTLNITSKARKTGTYTNIATVYSLEEDWNMSNNVANRTVKVSALGGDKTVNNETPFIGQIIEYNLTVINSVDAVYSDSVIKKNKYTI